MSPSAYLRGRGHSILYTLNYLAHLEQLGVRVVNGLRRVPRRDLEGAATVAVEVARPAVPAGAGHQPSRQAPAPSEGLRFPVVVKANIGGSGAGIVRYDRLDDLARAVAEGRVDLGLDQTALVQEYIPARGGTSPGSRSSTAGISTRSTSETGERFNLCPADICQDERWCVGRRGLPGGGAEERPEGDGVTPPADGDRRRGADHARRRHRGRRGRIHRRRPRRAALLLRHQRAVELRRRRPAGGRVRSVRPARRLPRARTSLRQGTGRPARPARRPIR